MCIRDRYAVEHIWEGKQEYFLIRDHQSWQMVLLPSKYLTHLIRANRSPNTVGRRAKSVSYTHLDYFMGDQLPEEQLGQLKSGNACIVRNPIPMSYSEDVLEFTNIEAGENICVAGMELNLSLIHILIRLPWIRKVFQVNILFQAS